jgi:hypothetical protein
MEITGHDIGTKWTVFYNPPSVELQAVTIWLAVWVLVSPCKITNTLHSNSGSLQRMLHCNRPKCTAETLNTHSATMVKLGWCLVFRCSLINSNFISCNNSWASVTTAGSDVCIGIEERRPDMKGTRKCTEYVGADRHQRVVFQFVRFCEVLASPTLTTNNVSKHFTSPRNWTDPWEWRKQWKRDMRFGTWNVKACIGQVHLQQRPGD